MNKEDIQAIIEIVWEELKTNEWSCFYEAKIEFIPQIVFRDVNRGRNYWTRVTGCSYKIVLPTFLLEDDRDERYVIWYVTHELCHCIYHDHGSFFKKLEASIMEKWGVEIEYARAYPKRLYADGEVIYESPREIAKKKGYWTVKTGRKFYLCERCKRDIFPNEQYAIYVKKGMKREKLCIECAYKKEEELKK